MAHINLKIEDTESKTCQRNTWHVPDELKSHYIEISQILNKAEAFYFTVGVFCLPITKRLRELKKQCYSPLEEYIRVNLINVPTTALQSYTEDLQQLPHDYSFSEQLGLNKLSFLERYSLVIFLFTACFGLPLISQYILNITSIFTLIISLCLAILVSALSLYTCSENYRRSTFHWLLSKEILRRKGLDRPNTSRISLYAIRTNPNT